nr:molybdopterin-dependent oxidoreductase [Kiritimatiellia bacterium]
TIVTGTAATGAQEHVYLETQGALAMPSGTGVRIWSATQAPTAVQRMTAQVLGIPMHRVEVDTPRLGGAFGGKEDQATTWAVLAALAARRLRRPVKLVLRRSEDMRWTGKRHPYTADFKLGLDAQGKFVAYEAMIFQDAGCSADLSTSVLERTLFHATNSYFIPHVRVTAVCCRTNHVSNTAFRGFGGPQGVFIMEAAIARAAEKLGVEARELQRKNLLREGDSLPFGQAVRNARATLCWESLETKAGVEEMYRQARIFNATHRRHKKGVAMQPVCFGISFTNRILNQASALVHIYSDGSVGVSTGAVEMGQGVNAKLGQIAARTLGITPARVKLETTNTTRAANTSPTAASTGTDLNGHALQRACEDLLQLLRATAARRLGADDPARIAIAGEQVLLDGAKTDLAWPALIIGAYRDRIRLSAQAHYATPGLTFDPQTNRGDAFAYHVFGTAVVEVTVDGLRGTYTLDRVRLVHDAGRSLDERIDRGQIFGALCQGLGWMTLEEIRYAESGRMLTDTLTTYKVPDLFWMPRDLDVHLLDEAVPSPGPYQSKAIGEPPFLYGIGAFFALREALRAFRPGHSPALEAPMTPERALMFLAETPRA